MVGDPKMTRRIFLFKLNCSVFYQSSVLMHQTTVVCSAVLYQKITDFSNDFFFFQTNRQKKQGLFFLLMVYFLFNSNKLSDNNLTEN